MRAPTLDSARSIGLHDLLAVCTICGERFAVAFATIDLPGDTLLEAIPKRRPIACAECSGPAKVDVLGMGFEPR